MSREPGDGSTPAAALSRRRLLTASASFVLVSGLPTSMKDTASTHVQQPSDDPARAILRAYVSTLVPGPADDPRGTPGAVEAGAVEQLLAQVPYVVPVVIADVTAAAVSSTGRGFASLPYPEREALLVQAFADPQRAPYHLIALAVGAGTFYGDFRNHVGGVHLGFPGPSDGYLVTYTDGSGHGQPQAEAVPA